MELVGAGWSWRHFAQVRKYGGGNRRSDGDLAGRLVGLSKRYFTGLQEGFINSKFADLVVTCSFFLATNVTPRWPPASQQL